MTVGDFIRPIRRSARELLIWIVLCLSLALVYILVTPAEYVASTMVVLKPRQFLASQLSTAPAASPTLDNAQVDSQVLVAKSENVLRLVFEERNLNGDPEYNRGPGLRRRVMDAIWPDGRPAPTPDSLAFASFSDRVSVRRVAQSHVLEISFRSQSPQKAASLANSVTASYVKTQISETLLSLRANGLLLQGRLEDLHGQEEASLAAVRNGLPPTSQFPASDARIISSAIEPWAKAYPQTGLILIATFTFALMSGLAAIQVRHSMNRTIWTVADARLETQVDCLGCIPNIRRRVNLTKSIPAKGGMAKPRSRMPWQTLSGRGSDSALLDMFSAAPNSFNDSIRALRTALIARPHATRPTVLGIVSLYQGEGKSVVAANLVRALAACDFKVGLVDADLRHRTLTRAFTPNAQSGLCESVLGRAECLPQQVKASGAQFAFIPAGSKTSESQPEIYVEPQFMLAALRELHACDYVVMEIPASAASSEFLSMAQMLDEAIVVIEVGRVAGPRARDLVLKLQRFGIEVIGTVLTKMPQSASV